MKIKLMCLGIIMCSVCSVWAQTVTKAITGEVVTMMKSETGEKLEYLTGATVVLLNPQDSSFVKGVITDLNGKFYVGELTAKDYLLEVSMLGFLKKQIKVKSVSENLIDVGTVIMDENPHQLDEITILGKKNLIKMEVGKTVINLSASVLGSQGSVLDALNNLPGVIVREDGTVYLNGQAGVNVMLDDKMTYMSGENLVAMLRSIPSTSVNKIELISHPSSKYDAAGNSGMINIQTKKVKTRGMSITASTNTKYDGKYIKGNEGLFVNIRKNKFNFHIDYTHIWGDDHSELEALASFFDPITLEPRNLGLLDIATSRHTYQNNTHAFTAGVDYDITEKLSLGTYLTYNSHKWHNDEIAVQNFINSDNGSVDSTLLTKNSFIKNNSNLIGGVKMNYKWSNLSKLDASFDVLSFDHGNNMFAGSQIKNLNQQAKQDTLIGESNGGVNIYTGQANLSHTFSEKLKFDVGVKTAFVTVNNSATYKNCQNGEWNDNINLNSVFSYNENVNAVYGQLSSMWNEALSTQMGLRMENTNIKGRQVDSVFKQNYNHLFSTLALQYQASEHSNFSLVYGRRIVRPNYRDLNPFIEVLNRNFYSQGNTELKPELSDNMEFSYVLKQMYSFNLFYSYRKDPITNSQVYLEDKDIIIATPENLASNHVVGIKVRLNNLKPFNWWTLHLNLSVLCSQYQWAILNMEDKNKLVTPMAHLSNQLSFPNGWSAELTGFYNGKMAYGQAQVSPAWTVSTGVKKKVFQNKGTVHLYLNDIFASNQFLFNVRNISWKGSLVEKRNTRIIGISLNYRFNVGSKATESNRSNRISESNRVNL